MIPENNQHEAGRSCLERLVRPLHWVAGPAMHGTSTAGDGRWWDGELLIIIIHHPDSRTVAMIRVSADVDHLNMIDPNTQDDITEWGFDDIAWWAKIEDEQLPPSPPSYTDTPKNPQPLSTRSPSTLCCASLLDAVEALLPHHSLACVSQPDSVGDPWIFHADEDGGGLVTEESCQCCGQHKAIRRLLSAHRKTPKGFSLHNA